MNELFNDENIILVVFVFGYLLYYFSYESHWVHKLASKLGGNENRKEFNIHIPRVIGFITLGIIPFIIVMLFFDRPITEYGFLLPTGKDSLTIGLGMIALTIFVSMFRSEKGINTDFYPQVRLQSWTRGDHIRNTMSWTLYLLGYEFMLRGPLFYALLYAFGLIPAIMINSVIYSLIHIYKGKGEAFGAFFLGILLCLVAAQTGSMVIPFVMHVILAVGNDLKALQATKS